MIGRQIVGLNKEIDKAVYGLTTDERKVVEG
jgi:hypothetical protein